MHISHNSLNKYLGYIELNDLNLPNAHAAEDAKDIFLRFCQCKPKTPETGRSRATNGDISAGLIEDDDK